MRIESALRGLGAFAFAVTLGHAVVGCSGEGAPPKPGPAYQEPLGVVAQAALTNSTFESDAIGALPAGWTVTAGLNQSGLVGGNNATASATNPPRLLANLRLSAGGTVYTQVVGGTTLGTADPSAPNLRFPLFGNRALKINSNASFAGASNNANLVQQTFTVTQSDVDPVDNQVHVRLAIAPVLESGGHAYQEQPFEFIEVMNVTKNTPLYTDNNSAGAPGVPWLQSGNVFYTDWQLLDWTGPTSDVSVGDQVRVTVVAAGCNAGGHFGRAYLDSASGDFPIAYVGARGPSFVAPNTTITYPFTYKNNSGATVTNAVVTISTPPNTTFVGTTATGCTTPAVGSAGTITCPVGTLAANQTGTFDVRVTTSASYSGLVTLGTYSLSGTGMASVYGTKVTTTIGVIRNVTVTKVNPTLGDVTTFPSVASCGSGCTTATGTVTNGTSITFTATPASGQLFTGWSGSCTGTGTTCTVAANADLNVTATFSAPFANGVSCTTNGQCASGTCGTNGKCGLADGQAGCTAGTGATICQSGVCSANGTNCRAANGCYINADCTAGDECNTSTLQCQEAPGIATSAGTTVYTGGGAAVHVDSALTVVGAAAITGATVTIGSGFVAAQDRLNFTNAAPITGSYNSNTGVLTLSGSGTAAQYQAALRSVTYSSLGTATGLNTAPRVIQIGLGSAIASATTGHFYEFVSGTTTWGNALTAAATRRYLGLTGYLATSTSQPENDFIATKLSADAWIAAKATPLAYPRTWKWMAGPENGISICANNASGICTSINGAYSYWNPGEPNGGGSEDCAQLYSSQGGRWNDLPSTHTLTGYVVEYGGMPGDPSVTLTATKNLQPKAATTVSLTTSNANANVGQNVTFTATFAPTTLTGTVQFMNGTTPLGAPVTPSAGVATFTTSALTAGTHSITVHYAGDTQRMAVTSAALTQNVAAAQPGSGTCTAATAATNCATGVCNTAAGVCGAATGATCTAANQCETNTCGTNGKCGLADGQSGCNASTGAVVCQSGVCSANNTNCKPAGSGACYVTADCAAGQQCNVGTLQCEVAPNLQTSAGETVFTGGGASVVIDANLTAVGAPTVTGATVTIGSGFVSSQDSLQYTNANGITGAYNTTTGVLTLSGSATSAAYQTALRSVRYANSGGVHPNTAPRVISFGLGSAVANAANDHFYEYVSFSGNWEAAKTNAAARTYLGLRGYLVTITSAAENDFIRGKLSSDGWIGAKANPQNSLPRTWFWDVGPEAGTAFCDHNSGSSCNLRSGAYQNWASGEPNNAGGEGCGQIFFQNSGRWNDLPCAGGPLPGYVVEYGGLANDPVLTLTATKTVQPKAVTTAVVTSSNANAFVGQSVTFTATLAPTTLTGTVQFMNGANTLGAPVTPVSGVATLTTSSLPVGVHGITVVYAGDAQRLPVTSAAITQTTAQAPAGSGTCTAATAATNCATGACNTVTGTCAAPSGSNCTAANQCLNNVCGSNGKCGFADGQSGCTAQTAATVCQSGVCSADGATCRSASGCWVDADCTGGKVCSPANKVCVEKATQSLTPATDTGFSQTDRVTSNGQPTVRMALTDTSAVAGDVAKVNNVGSLVGQATITAADIANGFVDVPLTTALPESGAGGITALGVRWADLTARSASGPPYTVSGTIATTTGGVTFTLSNTVPYYGVQTSGGTDYWAPPKHTPYLSNGVTQPPTSDIVQFNLAGTRTATFSEPVEGLYFAVVSLNGNGLEFDRDFDIVSQTGATTNCGFWGCGVLTKSLVTNASGEPRYRLNGASGEPHGVIRFKGVFSTVSWIALSNEEWNGATFGIGATSTEVKSVVSGIYKAAGALVTPSPTVTVTVDKTAPVAPAAPALAAADDTGTSSSDHLTSKTTDLTFSAAVEEGCYVTLFDDLNANGAVDSGEALAIDEHAATATFTKDVALANGAHKLRVFCTDLAGNIGAVSPIRSVTIGPVPAAPVIAGFSPDSGTPGDGVTSARTLTLTGTALAGSTVTLRDGAATLGTATATAGGTFTYTTPQLAFGAHAFTATATGVDLTVSAASAALEVVVQAPAGQGTCTVANQAVMCFSGTCNPTTGTCALPPGSPCTSGAQCVNGYCGVNGQCGLADGQSGCTAQTGPTVCQSGICSSDGVHCKPTSGCYGNGDCATGEQCNLGTLACELAPSITASAGDSNFEAGGAAVRVDPALTVVGAPTIPGATVTISGAFVAAQDRLNFAPVNGITGSYNQTTGVLTLTGTASTAAYQGALRSVTYSNTAGNTPNTAQRTVTFGLGSAVGYAANGHFYEVVSSSGTWAAAKTAAEGRTYLGLRGYLATITSPEENAYVFAKLAGDGWIGMQANSGTFPRTWSWVTGPEAGTPFYFNTGVAAGSAVNGGYFNWGPNQPDAAGGENVGQFYAGGGGKWNDLPSTYVLGAYVVEYGGMAGDPQTVLTATKRINLRAKATITVATSSQTSTFGNPVTLTATLAPTTVTGAVQFKDNGADLGAPVTLVNGVAALTTTALTVGNHTITAVYAGDLLHQPASGALVTYQTIVQLRNGQGPCTAANAANVCQSGVCGSSGTCGYGTGDGPCTAQNGSTVCNGGVCGSAGVCIPQVAGGCWVDGDCDASQYCERSSSTCKAKRVAGVAIPSDGLHDGTCTPANAAATCVSGACNATTNTCGVANGTACAAADQCASNRCSSGACIPSGAGSCWIDAECSAGAYCNRAAFTCTAKVAAGVPIPSDGLHDGACSVQTAVAVCATGLCNAALNTCGEASGTACSAPAQCTSNVCAASGACVPRAGACFADADCSGSQYCERNSFTCRAKLAAGSAIPNDGLHGGTCTPATATAVCAAGACNPATNTCGLALMAACQDSGECQSNHCARSGYCVPQATSCYEDPDCGVGEFCARSTYTCTPRLAPGVALPSDNLHATCPATTRNSACTTGRCNAAANTCADVDTTACSAAAQCVSNTCSGSGRCVPAGGAGCWADTDCDASQYCERASLTCRSDLADGVPIPSDGLRGGVCTRAAAAVVCASGACNPTTNTCAGIVGRSCTSASECEVNACQNGRCGIADGASGCTPETAYLCQSGACSPGANTCVPATGGCFVDADCGATDHCDRSTLKCVADKVAGAALPSDGLHDGVCSAALAQQVCVSGLCNAVTNTCAASNNAACVFAAECVANVCGANGQCGVPNGAGPCTVAAGAALCQSGRCNPSASGAASACIPQGASSCWVDSDCAGGSFCHRATFTCTPMLRSGAALPTDTLHDACVTGGFNAACATGRCNAAAGTCAAVNGATCAAANECVANACGTNGKCGLADGDGTCSAATATSLCQSGECAPQTSVCTPNGGCWFDADCDANEHCNRNAGTCAADLDRGTPMPTDGIRAGTCDAAAAQVVCATGACNASTSTCAAANGVACTGASQCVANVCGANGKCGLADGQSGCTPGSSATCQSGACSAEGVCIPTGAGACWVDADCAAAEHCKRDSFTCVADKAAGEALPTDTLHVGVCNDVTAQAVCASGRCNAVTNTCAAVNGATCTLAKECVVNVCGSNGKCGLAEGQGPCSESAATTCQSGACSSSGVCMPAGKCWVDTDCAADQYCKRDTTNCTAKERVGSPIPSDGLHDGTCTEANAAATCASGLCNAATNTCAAEAASACTAANQCASGVCAADGSCGTPGGQECTANAQCRSGNCVEGTCTIPGAKLSSKGLIECAVGEGTTGGQAPSPWAFLVAGAAVLLRRRRASGDEKTN